MDDKSNLQALLAQEALIQKLEFGTLDTSIEFHQKRIYKQTFYGRELKRYKNLTNEDAIRDIAKRLTESVTKGETTKVNFQVEMIKGKIDRVIWLSTMEVQYKLD